MRIISITCVISALLLAGIILMTGCSSAPKTETPSSLSREFKLIGENGEEAGTLTMDPQSRIILRDTEGKVSGKFMPEASTQTQSNEIKPEKQPEKQPEEAKSEDLEKQPESESVEVKTD